MNTQASLSPQDISAPARAIATEAWQLQHPGNLDASSARLDELAQELRGLQEQCLHTTKHNQWCMDCGKAL